MNPLLALERMEDAGFALGFEIHRISVHRLLGLTAFIQAQSHLQRKSLQKTHKKTSQSILVLSFLVPAHPETSVYYGQIIGWSRHLHQITPRYILLL